MGSLAERMGYVGGSTAGDSTVQGRLAQRMATRVQAMQVNGVPITVEDYQAAMDHGILPQGEGFTQWLGWALKNPLDATGQLVKGIAGFVVETGKDMVAMAEWAEMQAFGSGDRTQQEVDEINHRALRGLAFTGSMVAFGALGRVAMAMAPLVANITRGLVAGAVYGGIRPKELDENDRLEMIAKDAAFFGITTGVSELAGGVFRKLRGKPVGLLGPSEVLREYARTPNARNMIKTWQQVAARGPTRVTAPAKGPMAVSDFLKWREISKSPFLVEEAVEQSRRLPVLASDLPAKELLADGTAAGLKTVEPAGYMYVAMQGNVKGFGMTPQEALDQLGILTFKTQAAALKEQMGFVRGIQRMIDDGRIGEITEANAVRPLGPLYKGLMPIHTWERVWPGFRAIYERARTGRLTQEKEFYRWRQLITRTRGALNAEERVLLGDLLNQYVTVDGLPKDTPKKLATWFGEWRASLDMDRAKLAGLFGETPESWGIDAFFMHVWVGDWTVTGSRGQIIRFGQGASGEAGIYTSAAEARAAAERYLDLHPTEQIQIRPRRMLWDGEAGSALVMEPGQYIAYLRRAPDILGVSSIGKVKMGGEKWFANALDRETHLPGWLRDPTNAAEIYAPGYARKVAYHDFADTAGSALASARKMHEIDGTFFDAATEWVNRVVGRPSKYEQGWNRMLDWLVQKEQGALSSPITQRIVGEFRTRRLAGRIRQVESLWRLGWSPLSAFVNLSQSYVNTASKIGYRSTWEGISLLNKASLLGRSGNPDMAAAIDNLLVDMGVEFAVPLAAAREATFGATHSLPWWHPLYLFNKVETVNRGIASLAGYANELKAAGYSMDQLLQKGEGFVRRTIPEELHLRAVDAGRRLSDQVNFVYSIEDLPGLLASPAGQVLGQFKPFLISEINFISQLKGAERVRFGIHLATAGGVGAVMSLPIVNLVDYASGEITGERISEYAKRHAPRLARGFLGALGFSAEQSLALNSIMSGRAGVGDEQQFTQTWAQALGAELGPAANDALALGRMLSDITITGLGGKPATTPAERALIARQLMPVMFRRTKDAFDGIPGLQEGAIPQTITHPVTGRPIFAPDHPNVEALLTFMGFRSVEREEADRERYTLQRVTRQMSTARQNYIAEIIQALDRGEQSKVPDIITEARKHNIFISTDDVKNAVVRGRTTTGQQAANALPREVRKKYGDLYRSRMTPND